MSRYEVFSPWNGSPILTTRIKPLARLMARLLSEDWEKEGAGW